MDLKSREIGEVVVVEVNGKLQGGPDNSEKFRELFRSLIAEGKQYFVLNLQNTPWSDSHGVALLVGAHKSAAEVGGGVVLAHVNDRINGILNVMKVTVLLQVFDDEKSAVAHLVENPQTGA